jgi:hypothetical protein
LTAAGQKGKEQPMGCSFNVDKQKKALVGTSTCAFLTVQLQRLAPRGHKPIPFRRKERLLARIVLCLSGLTMTLALFL